MNTVQESYGRARRAVLFFPGTRPDQYAKAHATGADVVCMDLEDAVAPARKDDARSAAMALLERREAGGAELMLRINSPRTEAGLRDLVALLEAGVLPDAVMLPKVTAPEEVRWLDELLPGGQPGLIPVIETCRGLEAALEITAASPRVKAVMLGGVDLSAELGCDRAWEPLLYARSRVVQAAGSVGADVFDMPFLDTADPKGLEGESLAGARLGFTGKAAIHPRQVEAIQRAFSPTAEDVERAREIVAAFDASEGGVLLVDGRLVEPPVIRAAQRTLARAAVVVGRGR